MGATGTLTLEFSGSGVATSTQTTTLSYLTGATTLRLLRPGSIGLGSYDKLTARWNASTPPVFGSLAPGSAWRVLGTIRYTQYNTPLESACTGGTSTVYLVDGLSSCNYTSADLNASFLAQTTINGTGRSTSHGLIKPATTTLLRGSRACRGRTPADATLANTYLQVNSVIGSCNTVLVAGASVATPDSMAQLQCQPSLLGQGGRRPGRLLDRQGTLRSRRNS